MAVLRLPEWAYLRDCFVYRPRLGVLIWKRRPLEHFPSVAQHARWNMIFAGKAVGAREARSLRVKIGDQKYKLHRVIWKLVTGEDPADQIDHRNGNPFDNRWCNLRAATSRQNGQNRRRKPSKAGFKGVSLDKKSKSNPYRASIQVDGVPYYLGAYPTPELAHAAYIRAAKHHFGTFVCGGER